MTSIKTGLTNLFMMIFKPVMTRVKVDGGWFPSISISGQRPSQPHRKLVNQYVARNPRSVHIRISSMIDNSRRLAPVPASCERRWNRIERRGCRGCPQIRESSERSVHKRFTPNHVTSDLRGRCLASTSLSPGSTTTQCEVENVGSVDLSRRNTSRG